ncbi:hypothetical protein LTR78_008894 [Recurvomyces mirabilis]|uniref:protein disulfide-isomerase n=1 Tax=Recurvomyces mirabilis TaxID=574656 RepID=A0AAE0WIV0_9PEZI|nr:hypothetical protein LTR78_008894 [Recurvomyces mirabilis]KAK5155809.1 hypothetical protein LTS14_005375 [Recurvomyces mirabilis]
MLSPTTLALLALLPTTLLAEGLYSKNSPVLQIDGRSFRDQIEKSNHTSLIEFYAPWCGHCKSLQPAFEKAAKSLSGLAKVGAVNCDAEENKAFCGTMGVKGFPTLKIVRPGKKVGRPSVEEYQGGRTAKAMVDAIVERIPNHVARLKGAEYLDWLEGDRSKAILFSEKGTISALLKALAVDFLGVIDVAQVGKKEKEALEVFDVGKFPTLVLIPADGGDPVKYEGDMKKSALVEFLSRAGTPNPDPAPAQKNAAKSSTKSDKSKATKSSSAFSKASASHRSQDSQSAKASQTSETLEDASNPTESPSPNVVDDETQVPVKLPEPAIPISSLPDGLSLQQKCLNTKAGTCILALLPSSLEDPNVARVVASLSEIHHKHEQAKRNLFPFYQLPASNSQAAALRSKLALRPEGVEMIAVNGKQGWYRHYPKISFTQAEVEDWIDAIRMGDVAKSSLPDALVVPLESLPAEPVVLEEPSAPPIPVASGTPLTEDEEANEQLKKKLKGQLPEGMGFEMEEISDEDYERLLRHPGRLNPEDGGEGGGEGEGGEQFVQEGGHEEL